MKQVVPVIMLCVAAVVVMSLTTGCAEKFTRDRWDLIKVGVSDGVDVEAAIGEPQQKPFKDLWWYYKGDLSAKVYFDEEGRVKAKKWLDEETGEQIVVPKGWIEK